MFGASSRTDHEITCYSKLFLIFFSSTWSSASGTLPVSSNNWEFYKILIALSLLIQLGGIFPALKHTVLRTCLHNMAS